MTGVSLSLSFVDMIIAKIFWKEKFWKDNLMTGVSLSLSFVDMIIAKIFWKDKFWKVKLMIGVSLFLYFVSFTFCCGFHFHFLLWISLSLSFVGLIKAKNLLKREILKRQFDDRSFAFTLFCGFHFHFLLWVSLSLWLHEFHCPFLLWVSHSFVGFTFTFLCGFDNSKNLLKNEILKRKFNDRSFTFTFFVGFTFTFFCGFENFPNLLKREILKRQFDDRSFGQPLMFSSSATNISNVHSIIWI